MTKLTTILQHFSKIELNRLEKYLRSPYFNSSELLVQLFEIWRKQLDSTKEWTKEKMWQTLCPSEKYDDLKFRKYNSQLLKLIEGYLAQEEYNADPLFEASFLMQAVNNKQLDKLIKTSMRNADLQSAKRPYKPAEYYLHQYQIQRNAYNLKDFEEKRTERTNIDEIINNLDRFYLAEKLRYYCTLISQQVIVTIDYELLFIDEIIEHLGKHQYDDFPPIAIYYQIYLMQHEIENKNHFFVFKDLLKKYVINFPPKEANEIYRHALNYCSDSINAKHLQFLEEYYNIYVEFIDSKLIFEGAGLTNGHFKNIVTSSLRLKKYDWTEKFIIEYQKYLDDEVRENLVKFYLAQLNFYKKNFNKVIELLREYEYSDITYSLNSKTILIATYYEQNEFETLDFLLESFRVFINRHKQLPTGTKNNYLNYVKFVKKLMNTYSNDKDAIKKLREEFNETKGVVSANWLNEKIMEFEK